MAAVEDLFTLEAELRSAALNYADWTRASTPATNEKLAEHQTGINGSRKRLRAAAITFANIVRATEHPPALEAKKR